jgi:hypothetical protein
MPEQFRLITKNLIRDDWAPTLACYEAAGGYANLRQGYRDETGGYLCGSREVRFFADGEGRGFLRGLKWKFLDRKSGKPI